MPTCTHTHSEEEAAMVDGNLPAPQSTHTEAPAAAAYVPVEGGGK